MAAKAQEISQEAGSKMASAMRDVISAAAGLASFSVDSARDLVQYMVRRGQMTQDEADKLIREAEVAAAKRNVNLPLPPSKQPKPPPPPPVVAPVVHHAPVVAAAPVAPAPPPKPVAREAAHPPAPAKHAVKKVAAKHASSHPAKKAPAKAAPAAKKKPAAKKR